MDILGHLFRACTHGRRKDRCSLDQINEMWQEQKTELLLAKHTRCIVEQLPAYEEVPSALMDRLHILEEAGRYQLAVDDAMRVVDSYTQLGLPGNGPRKSLATLLARVGRHTRAAAEYQQVSRTVVDASERDELARLAEQERTRHIELCGVGATWDGEASARVMTNHSAANLDNDDNDDSDDSSSDDEDNTAEQSVPVEQLVRSLCRVAQRILGGRSAASNALHGATKTDTQPGSDHNQPTEAAPEVEVDTVVVVVGRDVLLQ